MTPLQRALLLALLAAAAGAGITWLALPGRRGDGAGGARTLLLTGFGPFGEFATNPAWECAKALDGAVVGHTKVVAARIDVSYAKAADQLREAVARVRPDDVLCLGVAGGDALRLEVVARNRDACPAPDNDGEVREDEPIRPDGPDLLPSGLPVRRLLARLEADGYEVVTSEDAGGYLCNHLFYRLMDGVQVPGVAGFVHVPPLAGRWDAERLQGAIRAVLEVIDAGS